MYSLLVFKSFGLYRILMFFYDDGDDNYDGTL